jgi:uncharacterized protein (DUF2249 family)
MTEEPRSAPFAAEGEGQGEPGQSPYAPFMLSHGPEASWEWRGGQRTDLACHPRSQERARRRRQQRDGRVGYHPRFEDVLPSGGTIGKEAGLSQDSTNGGGSMARLDVRPMMAEGQDPFGAIMQTVERLEPDEEFELLAPLEPVPLYEVLGARGFQHQTWSLGGGDYRVVFRRFRRLQQEG